MMKRVILTIAASLLLPGVAVASDEQKAQDQIAADENALGVAMIHRDVATLSKLVADDWTIQNSSGVMGTKAEFINDVKSGKLAVTAFKVHDMHIHVLGNVAYVQAFDDEKTSYDGKESSGTYNWLDVWVKRDGHWVSVATQLTRVDAKN